MESNNYFTISLDLSEVFALANLNRVETWPGICIPTGTKTEAVQQAVEKGIASLSQKKWLGVTENNGPVMLFSPIMQITDAVKHPWMLYAAFPGKTSQSRWLYLRPGDLMDQELSLEGCLQFTFSRDLTCFNNRLEAYLGLDASLPAPTGCFTLSKVDRKGLAEAKNSESVTEKLKMFGMPPELISALTMVITGQQTMPSIVMIDPVVPENITKTITWVSTPAGTWLVHAEQIIDESKDWCFIPISGEELRQKVLANIVQPTA